MLSAINSLFRELETKEKEIEALKEKVSEVNEAIEFADWIRNENITESAFFVDKWDYKGNAFATSELYQIYKSQK